jgi:hypothetical protein
VAAPRWRSEAADRDLTDDKFVRGKRRESQAPAAFAFKLGRGLAFGRGLFKRTVPLWFGHSSALPSEAIPAIKRQARSASVGRRSRPRRSSGARPRAAGASGRESYLRRRVSPGTAKSAAVVMAANRAVKRMSIRDMVFVSSGWGQERRPCERRVGPSTRPLKKRGRRVRPPPPNQEDAVGELANPRSPERKG